MQDSKANSLSSDEKSRIIADFLIFFIPVINIYLGYLIVVFNMDKHTFSWLDFVPAPFVLGAAFKHFQDTLINIYGKYKAGK